MFKGPGKIVRDNKSSSYPVFELTGVNCKKKFVYFFYHKLSVAFVIFKSCLCLKKFKIW